MMGTDITRVSNPEKQEMTRALAQFNYSSPAEAQDIVDIMTAYINEERGKGPTPNAADLIAVVENANKDITATPSTKVPRKICSTGGPKKEIWMKK